MEVGDISKKNRSIDVRRTMQNHFFYEYVLDRLQKKYTCHKNLPTWHQTQSCQWTSFDKLSNHHCLPQSYSIPSTTKCKVPSSTAYQESTYIPQSRHALINSSQTNQHTAHPPEQTHSSDNCPKGRGKGGGSCSSYRK